MLPNRLDHQRLDLDRRDAAHRAGTVSCAVEQGGGQIVPVFGAALTGVARAHAIAAVIEDATGEQVPRMYPGDGMIVRLLAQLGLDGLEEVLVENGGLLALQHLALEADLANIEAIAKEVGERTARKRNAANFSPVLSFRTLLTMPRLRSSAISRLRLPSSR